MYRKKKMSKSKESRKYWDDHPIGAEPLYFRVGSTEFYKEYLEYYDQIYDYKWNTFRYDQYKGQRVLEIGCGLGIDSIKFAKNRAKLVCIDLSNTSVRCTKNLIDHFELNAAVMQADAQFLNFKDNSLDAVYAYGVLMHVEDENIAVKEIYRVLKPNGKALVVVYHRRSWFWLLAKLSGSKIESEDGDPPLNRVYSIKEIRNLFSRFADVEISLDRFPSKTRRRKGLKAFLYNWIFVPIVNLIPKSVMRPFGWHIIIKAKK
jgi:ubiquinone/menaquinone biosynthesis C-methylase UbiE